MPRLVVFSGVAAGQTFDLSADEIVIGRDATNQVAIADQALSRRHCVLVRTPEGWKIRDLGSINGVVVNGQHTTEQLLQDGDHVLIGKTELLLRLDAEPPPAETARDDDATVSLKLEDALYLKPSAEVPELARVQRDLQALVRIGTALAAIDDRDTLHEHLLDAAFDIVPADTAMLIAVVDSSTAGREMVSSRQRRPGELPAPSRTVVDDVVAKRVAFLSNHAISEARLSEARSVVNAGISSILAVPLLDRGRPGAVLYLTTTDPDTTFDRLHLEVITALAGIGSAALGSVGRVESLKARSQRLQKRLRIKHGMVGEGEAMLRIRHDIARAAPTNLPVLITGETGTGKELAARALHFNSKRAEWPFVAVNCATLGEHLAESELFGHEKGAFTSAVATRRGKFELADRGTIFLDEIGELPPAHQAKLLRALQEGEFERVGGTRPIKVDVRLVAATNRDLGNEVREGRFRKDLFYRLEGFSMMMPALRDRREDIADLARHFADRAAARAERPAVTFSEEAMQRLRTHDWPGNVREFENVIQRAVALCAGDEILPEDLPDGLGQPTTSDGGISRFEAAVNDAKRRVIREALVETGHVKTDAARLLGLHPNYLHRLMNSLGMRTTGESGRSSSDDD